MKKGWGLSLLHPPLPFPLPLFLTIGAERLGTADSDTAYLWRDNPAFEVGKKIKEYCMCLVEHACTRECVVAVVMLGVGLRTRGGGGVGTWCSTLAESGLGS